MKYIKYMIYNFIYKTRPFLLLFGLGFTFIITNGFRKIN